MRASLAMLFVAGCGRIGFDGTSSVADAAPTGDAPPLPDALVCEVRQLAIGFASSGADLAITARLAGGFTLAWADPRKQVVLVDTDAQFTALAPPRVLTTDAVTGIGGMMATPQTTLLVTARDDIQSLWRVDADAQLLRSEPSVMGREPLFTDATTIGRAWVRGTADGIRIAYVADDGTLGVDNTTPKSAPITALSAANQQEHLHLTWAEGNPCFVGDMQLMPLYPTDSGIAHALADSCAGVRADTGEPSWDSVASAYVTEGGAVAVRHIEALAQYTQQLSPAGRAPKLKFDGTAFWAAWLEGDELQLAHLERDLQFTRTSLPGWSVVGDEAFELVRSGSSVHLALLAEDTASLLELCQSAR